MSPAPTPKHQLITGDLFERISGYARKNTLGRAVISPCDVYLDEHSNAVQPDIIFIASANMSILKDDAIHGVPNLLIEVLSRGNVDYDTVKKKNLYEKFGVREYWIVNPDTKETIGYSLKNQTYAECGRFTGKIVSVLLNQQFDF